MKNTIHYTYQSPKTLEAIIRKSIIGQDEGVRMVATAISAHLMRIEHNQQNPDQPLFKSNLWIQGSTGCGKTQSIQTAVNECHLPVPVAIINASMLTASGYKGKSAENILSDLVASALRLVNQNPQEYIDLSLDKEEKQKKLKQVLVTLANKGIIILDEVDKLRIDPERRPEDNFFAESSQRQLLRMLEGGSGYGNDAPESQIDTSDILFVCCGAHVGLDEIIKTRLKAHNAETRERKFGFITDTEPIKPQKTINSKELMPENEDLISYGYIPEIVGRLPLKCKYKELTQEILYKILTDSKLSPTKESVLMLEKVGATVEYTEDALQAIAQKAYEQHIGARALRGIVSKITYPLLYEQSDLCNRHYVITKENIINNMPPKPIHHTKNDELHESSRNLHNENTQKANKKGVIKND